MYNMKDIQRTFMILNIRAVNKGNYKRKSNTEYKRQMLELDYGDNPREIKRKILKYV